MPSSTAVPAPATATDVQSPIASDSDEYEYEEIEIEEEIEVEEEVSDEDEEEEEEQKESGEELSPSIEGRDHEKGNTTLIDDDDKAPKSDGGMMSTETINKSSKEVTGGDPLTGLNESDKNPHSEEDSTKMNAKAVDDTNQKELRPTNLSPSVEINQENKRPALMCNFFARGWCIKGNSCRFRHIRDQQNETSVTAYEKSLIRDLEGVKEVEPESQKENPETTSSNIFMGTDIHRSNWVSSYTKSIEEIGGRGYHFGFHNHMTPTADYSLNNTSISSQSTRKSTLLSCSSWNSATNFSTYDWEPSKPFRSSFLISQGITSPSIQYDPIRDSIEIEPPKIGDKFSKMSSSSQIPSMSSPHLNPPVKETDYGSDRISLASHVNSNDNAMDMNSNACEFTSKMESTKIESTGKKRDATEASEMHLKVGDDGSQYHVNSNDNAIDMNSNACEFTSKMESRKIESTGKNRDAIEASEMHLKVGDDGSQYHNKLDYDTEGNKGVMQGESKALKHFRAALIEFVKELVKPSWHEGKISKDAHKLIVKKAVDKVLNTLPEEHIPTMQEYIEMYLSASQPKLMKLVEAYVEKYGKK